MRVEKIKLPETKSFSSTFLDYVADKDNLSPFYGQRPTIEAFEAQIRDKQYSGQHREVLCKALNQQYQSINKTKEVNSNLTKLSQSNTFTITTGHQLNIFTGPLYFIYKIATVVNAAKTLSKKYPDQNFVPVYWMASEDHDFEEISYFNLFGKKHQWESTEKGAVGRFSTESLYDLLDNLPEKVDLFETAYREHENLADAVRHYVNELFGESGVIVIDADDAELKRLFVPVIKDDLIHHTASQLVEKTNNDLESIGTKPQIYARDINFFYLQEQSRERIIQEGDSFKVNNTSLVFTSEELMAEVDAHPERFSPNVVMRPLYQEMILPNLAYTGGPAEVVYWMQLKRVFDHYQTNYPILLPRNFALYINKPSVKKMDKFELSVKDIFSSESILKQAYLQKHSENEVELSDEIQSLKLIYEGLADKAETIDGSLKGFIASEHTKASKGIDNIGKRLKKSEEKKHEIGLTQLSALKQKLFPNGGLQERHDNFLNYYINNPEFVNQVLASLDAFDMSMHVMMEE